MASNPPTISNLPATPDRADRPTFSARCVTMFDALKNAFVGEVNALAAWMKSTADEVQGNTSAAAESAAAALLSAESAGGAAGVATTKAGEAVAARDAAAASYDAFGDRYLGSKYSDPTVDNDGNPLLTGALYWNDSAGQMRVWSGSAWVVAYLPGGSYVAGPNSATDGDIVVFDGTTGKLIKALAKATQAEMEGGTEANLRAMSPLLVKQAIAASLPAGSLLRVSVFTASGTWTKGAGTKKIRVRGVGAGAGGQRYNSSTPGRGGYAGGYTEKSIDVNAVSSVAVTVGQAGTGGTMDYTNGTSGGTSSFGSYCSATGGTPSSPGNGVGGDINIPGGAGWPAGAFSKGGESMLGPGSDIVSSNGSPGIGYGSGGSGSVGWTYYTAGSGANGVWIIEEYA